MKYGLLYWPLLLLASSLVFANDNGPYKKTSTALHEMRVINSGLGALYARVDMIRRAKTSIELESFIFENDTSGKILLNELAAAAKRGVKVRVLIDKAPTVAKLDEFIAKEMKSKGIDLRYYNPVETGAQNVFYRNHKKLMIRDGEEALTGGRNIGDAYFDLSEKLNYLDRDVTVEGKIVAPMRELFDKYWNSPLTKNPVDVSLPEKISTFDRTSVYTKAYYDRKFREVKNLFVKDKHYKDVLKVVEQEGKHRFLALPKRTCPEVSYISDKEGGAYKESLNLNKYIQEYRYVSREIINWINAYTGNELVIDNPYYLKSDVTKELLAKLKDKKIKLQLFTNSLASTDAIHVASRFKERVKAYTQSEDFKGFMYRGDYAGEGDPNNSKIKKAGWSTHSKTIVFNDDTFAVGSYNMDNRSSFYNTEMMLFCKGSPELTKDIKNNIQMRMFNSLKLKKDGEPEEDCIPTPGIAATKYFLYYLLKIPAKYFEDQL